jgi:hypothetical protein
MGNAEFPPIQDARTSESGKLLVAFTFRESALPFSG